MNHGVREGRLTAAPFVWLPSAPPGKIRWLTRDEAAALLRAARSEPSVRLYLPLFILLGLYTGAREEAILSLRWTQVDLVRDRIDFNPPGRSETNKRRPIIPIPRRLGWFLRKAHERAAGPYVIRRDGRRGHDWRSAVSACGRSAATSGIARSARRRSTATTIPMISNAPLRRSVDVREMSALPPSTSVTGRNGGEAIARNVRGLTAVPNFAKVGVVGSNPIARSIFPTTCR